MAVIALTSAAGSPGVTTAAVGVTLSWPGSVILVDADPGAHQAVLAGYLRGEVATGKGLQRVAEAHRDGRGLDEVVSDETVPLTGAGDGAGKTRAPDEEAAGPRRRFLPGFARPANAALFAPVWPDLMETFSAYEQAGIDVILDLGRMDHRGVPQAVVDRADLVALLTRSSLRAVAGARGYAARLREQARATGVDTNGALLLVGENQPYGRREIAKLLNLPVAATLADDPESASVLSDGAHPTRRFHRGPLWRSLHRAVDDLTSRVRQRRVRLGLAPPGPPDAPSPGFECRPVIGAVTGASVGAGGGSRG